MHVSPLLLGVAQLTLITAAALPRSPRARGRTHAGTFLKLRSPPVERSVAPADVYRRPTAADDVPVSTDSIASSSGNNTQQPDAALDSDAVASLVASTSSYETFTYSNYSPQSTPAAPARPSASVDAIQQVIQQAQSYAVQQSQTQQLLPTVTVHLVMEPTQEADGTWDYVVKVGADGTATAVPTFVSATPIPTSSSATDYYVPLETAASASPSSSSVYYGNTHTYNASSPLNLLRTLITTTTPHEPFQCATPTSYYYSSTSDATQLCPGGTVCRFVNEACSPCVWPDQDIWCAGKIYPFLEPESSDVAVTTGAVPTATYATASVTETETATESAGPTQMITTTTAPEATPTSYVYGSGYASASGETGRSAVTFTYSSFSSMPAPESTAWTSGNGGQHSYPWMTGTVESDSQPVPTAQPAQTTTLSNGAVVVTVAPSSAVAPTTTVNSWLVSATKGIDPVQGGASSSASSSESITAGPSSTGSAPASYITDSVTASAGEITSSASEPAPTATATATATSTSSPGNETAPAWSNVETATATDSVFIPTTSTQSANEGTITDVVSSSSGYLVPSSPTPGNGTTASITSGSGPEVTASASASVTDSTDNGFATETVTDWDIVNATSTTYVPYETGSPTATYTGTVPTTAPNSTITSDWQEATSSVESASPEPTNAFTSPIIHQWPTNETASATDLLTASASSTESTWASITASVTSAGSSVQSSESATSSQVQSTESVTATATATSSAAESTETGDEDECEEWEEVWVDERDIQDDWIIVE